MCSRYNVEYSVETVVTMCFMYNVEYSVETVVTMCFMYNVEYSVETVVTMCSRYNGEYSRCFTARRQPGFMVRSFAPLTSGNVLGA